MPLRHGQGVTAFLERTNWAKACGGAAAPLLPGALLEVVVTAAPKQARPRSCLLALLINGVASWQATSAPGTRDHQCHPVTTSRLVETRRLSAQASVRFFQGRGTVSAAVDLPDGLRWTFAGTAWACRGAWCR